MMELRSRCIRPNHLEAGDETVIAPLSNSGAPNEEATESLMMVALPPPLSLRRILYIYWPSPYSARGALAQSSYECMMR